MWTRLEGLSILTWMGTKDDSNLYLGWAKKDGLLLFPTITAHIDPDADKPFLDELAKTMGGIVSTGYNGLTIPPCLVIQEQTAINILYPMDQLIWPLERSKTDNGAVKGRAGREILKTLGLLK